MNPSLEPLAITGISLKFPGDAVSAESFWKLIIEGRLTMRDYPPDRSNIDAFYHADHGRLDQISARGANFLNQDISRFDASFFSINAAEAEAMDPQQRLILETVYHAFENAGMTLDQVSGSKTCVYAGSFGHDYSTMQVKDPIALPKFSATGTGMTILSNRVSWFFNLTGPSATVDTACSSSLMAVDLACQSIWSGDSSMGVAIGSNVIIGLDTSLPLDNLGLLSSDSRSYSFDQRGNGYARGEGVGVLVLRPLKDAIDHNDTIRAVIRSSGSNQDGRTQGITQPSMDLQQKLILDTYKKANLDLSLTSYVEAHGTGTAVGDPIEAQAIGSVFRHHRIVDDPVYIGSVKSTIGHLEGASGIAGVIKTVMALENGIIPPNTDFQQLNPRIDDVYLRIKVADKQIPWPTDGLRRASVSSFGFGGSNSHIVLDDAYHSLQASHAKANHNTTVYESNGLSKEGISSPMLLVLSSTDEDGFSRLKDAWGPFFSSLNTPTTEKQHLLNNLAYTLCLRRSHLSWRTFAVVYPDDDWSHLIDNLAAPQHIINSPNLAFIFSGQGAQWYAMGRELLDAYPVFCESIRAAGAYIQTFGCQWDLIDELRKGEAESNVNKTEYSQMLCTALQIALVDLLHHVGIVPEAVVGHSSGEIAAAYCAHAITRESAWKIAFYRGLWTSKLERFSSINGAMLAVTLSPQAVAPFFKRATTHYSALRLTVACINSPHSVTVSGEQQQIDTLKEYLDKEQIFCRRLKVRVAYHSFQMNEIETQYHQAMGLVEGTDHRGKRPNILSSVTGTWISHSEMRSASYWVQNLVSTVNFCDALTTLCSNTTDMAVKKLDGSHRKALRIHHLLDVGPHSVLQGPVKDTQKGIRGSAAAYYPLLVRGQPAVATFLQAVGHLYAAGYPTIMSRVNPCSSKQEKPMCLPSLPEYPFNHSRSYWHESQISRNQRLPKVNKNDLLGMPESNWNPLEPRWRHIIRASDLPWIEDHQVSGTVIYPAAGMLVMAIEAVKQLASPDRVISGFKFEDTAVLATIRIPPGDGGVETAFYMRPQEAVETKSSQLFSFTLCTYVNETWLENCRGRIHIVYKPVEPDPVNGNKVEREDLADSLSCFSKARERCTSLVYRDVIYDHLAKCGYEFGKAFRQIHTLATGGKSEQEVVGDMNNFQVSTQDIIHTTTLDGILQTMPWSMTKGGTITVPGVVPTYIGCMWVAGESSACNILKTHTVTETSANGTLLTSIKVFDQDLREIIVSIEGLKSTATTSESYAENTNAVDEQLCHYFEWKPDINLLSNKEIHALCHTAYPNLSIPKDFLVELDFLVMLRIMETLRVISERDIKPQKTHLRKYIDWMTHHKGRLLEGELIFSTEPWKSRFSDSKYIQGVESRVMSRSKQGKLLVKVTRHLVEFLNNELDPLALFYQDDMAKDYYAELLEYSHCFRYLEKYVDLLAHSNPQMNILEVGAGTGCATAALLRILRNDNEQKSMNPRYAHWEYTDISRLFLGDAAKHFASEGSRMAFKLLNIEEDPADQGFEYATYDLLLACMVFHATSDLARTLTHARKLLKPGGKLILVELTNPCAIRSAGAFGLLDGWWLSSEPYRSLGPFADEAQWNSLLLSTGFAGCEIFFPDYDDQTCHETAVIISTATQSTSQSASDQPIDIVYEPNDRTQLGLGRVLARHYATQSQSVRLIPIQDAIPSSKVTLQVFLLEYQKPLLYDIREGLYNRLQALLLSTDPILWVTSGGGKLCSQPKSHLIDGLFRVLPEEDRNRSRYVLALDPMENPEVPQYETIAKLTERILRATEVIDTEYIESNGVLHIPRLTVDPVLNKAVSERERVVAETKQKFGSGPPLKLDVSSPCMSNGFKFIEDCSAQRPLGPNDIEIQNRSVGINFRDLLVSLGQLESNYMGLECAGVVVRVGNSCRRFKVGDRVVALHSSAFSTLARIPETGPVAVIPTGMSYADAASIPVSFVTSYITLRQAASMQSGESILIHSGAGGTGQAAIQIAQYLGAEIYTTVGSEAKKQLLIDTYGIPENHIFSSRSTGFAKAVMRRTAGKGVDVVFNSLSGDAMLASWECIAAYGRFIETGKRDILSNNGLPLGMFARNTTFRGFDLTGMMMDRPDICLSALEDILSLMSKGILRPVQPLTSYGIGEIEAAVRFMQTGKHQGKLVLEIQMDDMVMTVLDRKPNFTCDGSATYVIAGGLGGIGQSIAAWLVDRGVRNLLLLSRSGAKATESIKFINYLHSKGTRVIAPACDISNESALSRVLEEWQPQLPPIKGCIQAAMVLQDCTFEDMSYKDWETAVKPKVQGSWNLHCLLPKGMEFFILLSSQTGIVGAHGQANYAAGNTFQDALARYRVNQGERATSLDLGHITYTGAVASNQKLLQRWQSNSVRAPVTEAELKGLIDCYSSPLHGYELDCQPIIGVYPRLRERGSGTPTWLEKPLFKCMTLDNAQSRDLDSRGQNFQVAAAIRNAQSLPAGSQAVTRALTAKLSHALALDEKEIDPDKHLSKYGVDSLVAVELRTWFAGELKANIAIFDIIGSTVATVAQLAASRSKLQKGYSA
ncbi:putative polyketide synthase [Aspergillus nomiae NRRL 13137]|uniref:Putative polyketide synthase n=2 Tax=Aspergillus subgen. Circumdati TaxID=2720871 RepID=A0A0L1INJ0_ASPN3|nr:putative polyketide synthase [Aspergillus nomiae NRRL 13137]KNG81069.1 putative polyketide synthase [Aspergillus nomiae NRRL 13137]